MIRRYLNLETRLTDQQRLSASARSGLKMYETLCITCHGKDGKGVRDGEGFLAPPLRKDRWFMKRRVDVITRILLKGETGPIGEQRYGEGLMLPLENIYSDTQLADMINYIGLTWNNWKKPIAAAEIQRIRAEIAHRKSPYTNKELEAVKRRR